MKFKYIGDLPIKNADLVLAGIFKPIDVIHKGTVFEVPDDNVELISRMKITGNYIEYEEPKKISKSKKKFKKEKKEEKEDKEEK